MPTSTSYIDRINDARRTYRMSPQRKGDWCEYLRVTEQLRKEYGR